MKFADDRPAITAKVTRNEKTGAWWSSFSSTEISVPYNIGAQGAIAEPYMINIWIVREADAPPDLLGDSAASWRSCTIDVNGAEAIIAAMDSDNDAVFTRMTGGARWPRRNRHPTHRHPGDAAYPGHGP